MCQCIRLLGRARHPERPLAAAALLGTLLAFFAGLAQPAAAQGGYVVIVNAANPVSSVSRDELSRIFLKKTSEWSGGGRALPADLTASSKVRARFSQEVHGKDTAAIKAYWQKMIFSGRGVPPAELASSAEVAAFVAANRGAVGYVGAEASLAANVKVIRVVP